MFFLIVERHWPLLLALQNVSNTQYPFVSQWTTLQEHRCAAHVQLSFTNAPLLRTESMYGVYFFACNLPNLVTF